MLDSGADRDVISETVIQDLEIETTTTNMRVITVDNEMVSKRTMASFIIESLDGNYVANVTEALVGRLLTSESDIAPCKRELEDQPHLKDVEFDAISGSVEIIIGAAHFEASIPEEVKKSEDSSLLAYRCAWGWTLTGRYGGRSSNVAAINAISAQDETLNENLQKIFYHDFSIVSEEEMGESKENKDAIAQIAKSTYFDETLQKYVVGLPWRLPREEMTRIFNEVDSRGMAMKRLKGMIPRMRKDPARKERIFKEMNKFVETDVAVEIDSTNDDSTALTPRWHLPIHDDEKKKGKTRVCHNARAAAAVKSGGSTCLNEWLLGGPNLMNSLAELLIYMRIHKWIFLCDIKAFFHQVRVHPEDADAFRYPWFADEKLEEAIMMRFKSHVFGSVASSATTSYALRHLAETVKDDYPPDVHDMMRNRFYVDDGMGGADDEANLIRLKENVVEAMKRGGFELCKFKSNHPAIMEADPKKEVKIGEKEEREETTKVLGVSWIPEADVFTFNYDKNVALRSVTTPRELVSVQASLYDPLGFISPFQYHGRRMLQRAEAAKNGWDNPLNPKLREECEKWSSSIPQLAKLRIPRWWNCGCNDPIDEQIHCFGDAAAGGYGAVVYRRIVTPLNEVKVVIVTARSHVVPLNPSRASHHNSIPRLEMTAAAKTVELKQFVERASKTKAKIVLWSDSEATLKMINDFTTPFRSFFSNRLSKIHAASVVEQWRFVDSENNPADHTSRGIQAHEAEKWKEFHYGPPFLYRPEHEWPVTDLKKWPMTPKVASIFALAVQEEPKDKEENFFICIAEKKGGWFQKLRLIAKVKIASDRWRMLSKAKTRGAKANVRSATTKMDDLKKAEKDLVRAIQKESFANEIDQLIKSNVRDADARGNLRTAKTSSLRPHNPYIDAEGIMRVGSRLMNADIEYEAKFPAILPPKDENVKALVRDMHEREQHAGPKHTLCQIRKRYWINRGLQTVKSVIHKCATCQKTFKAPLKQKMAPLPVARVTPTAPFEETGVDLMGHFNVKFKNSRAIQKVWISVFTCLSTRAVHAELVYHLDADSMINAIVRFNARRPGVRRFTSDRGTNLVASNSILRKEMEKWNASIETDLQKKGIEWNFIPAGTPHYGGVYERIVGLFKRKLATAVAGDILHVDTFHTIVVEAEAILNRRPLTALSTDSTDTEPLTPAHILYPATFSHSSASIIPESIGENSSDARASWKRAQSRINAFWNAWSSEYLALLHSRSKWTKTKDDMAVGDLVIITDETLQRNSWKLGRVITIDKTGSHVRRATVKRGDGKVLLKDRSKLVLLELDEEKKQNG